MERKKGKQQGKMTVIWSFGLVLLISGFLLVLCGYNPVQVFALIAQGAFGSKSAVIQTLTQTTPPPGISCPSFLSFLGTEISGTTALHSAVTWSVGL